MGRRDNDLGLVAANGAGEVTTQKQAVLEHAVGLDEGSRDLYAPCRAVVLVLGAQRQRLRRRDPVDAGLAVGGQQVAGRLALPRPAVDRCVHP
jgi:hypothetical protein